jgi:hypothetical protein
VVDNSVLLSETAIRDVSQGGSYAHNLISGDVVQHPEPDRETPYHEPHSTAIAGLSAIEGGDDRFYNNLFVGGTGLSEYDDIERPVWMAGNVFLDGSEPSVHAEAPVVRDGADPAVALTETDGGVRLRVEIDEGWNADSVIPLVTTDLLGEAAIPGAAFENPDGSPLSIDADYFDQPRDPEGPLPGPFARPADWADERILWPK